MALEHLAGKTVLLTGHTGFKGSWVALWLSKLGCKVFGVSHEILPGMNNFVVSGVKDVMAGHEICDICDYDRLTALVAQVRPDAVLHMAAQAIVGVGYSNPRETFASNVMGTVNVLEAVRESAHPCAVVVISSDKCYENREHIWGYRECDPMGGHDPYSASKGCTEIVASSMRRSFFAPDRIDRHGVALASARAGNVIGGGDWAANRLIPDIVRALEKGDDIVLRQPGALRPWQHVLEPLSGYLTLLDRMLEPDEGACYAKGWNFGPRTTSTISVGAVTDRMVALWGGTSRVIRESTEQQHEAMILRLSIEQAEVELGWQPKWAIDETLSRTLAWYRTFAEGGADMRAVCLAEIEAYESLL